jgi:hypothetical protein
MPCIYNKIFIMGTPRDGTSFFLFYTPLIFPFVHVHVLFFSIG